MPHWEHPPPAKHTDLSRSTYTWSISREEGELEDEGRVGRKDDGLRRREGEGQGVGECVGGRRSKGWEVESVRT